LETVPAWIAVHKVFSSDVLVRHETGSDR
jgi:hypothetical protein